MTKTPEGWKLSIRDDSNLWINNTKKPKQKTAEEMKKVKKEIIERHEYLGLDKNLKKELYPSIFKWNY